MQSMLKSHRGDPGDGRHPLDLAHQRRGLLALSLRVIGFEGNNVWLLAVRQETSTAGRQGDAQPLLEFIERVETGE